MNTRWQIYQAPEDSTAPTIPIELQNAREVIIRNALDLMRLWGIMKITSDYKSVGIAGIHDVTYKPMADTPPKAFLESRNKVTRNLAELLLLFGILGVELLPNESEMVALKEDWQNLGKRPEDASEQKVEMNVDVDPTGESILDNNDYETDTKPEQQTGAPEQS